MRALVTVGLAVLMLVASCGRPKDIDVAYENSCILPESARADLGVGAHTRSQDLNVVGKQVNECSFSSADFAFLVTFDQIHGIDEWSDDAEEDQPVAGYPALVDHGDDDARCVIIIDVYDEQTVHVAGTPTSYTWSEDTCPQTRKVADAVMAELAKV